MKPRGTFELQLPALALTQEADGAGAGMSQELAVKRLDGAREIIAVVGGGGGEALGVQPVGSLLAIERERQEREARATRKRGEYEERLRFFAECKDSEKNALWVRRKMCTFGPAKNM